MILRAQNLPRIARALATSRACCCHACQCPHTASVSHQASLAGRTARAAATARQRAPSQLESLRESRVEALMKPCSFEPKLVSDRGPVAADPWKTFDQRMDEDVAYRQATQGANDRLTSTDGAAQSKTHLAFVPEPEQHHRVDSPSPRAQPSLPPQPCVTGPPWAEESELARERPEARRMLSAPEGDLEERAAPFESEKQAEPAARRGVLGPRLPRLHCAAPWPPWRLCAVRR